MKIVPIKKAPSDTAELLREMADKAERGELTDIVTAYVDTGNYVFTYGASLNDCLILSTMLQQNCIDRLRA
jgi:hypothetical protein